MWSSHIYEMSHAIWDHTVLPYLTITSRLIPNRGWYSIYWSHKDEWLSWPKQLWMNSCSGKVRVPAGNWTQYIPSDLQAVVLTTRPMILCDICNVVSLYRHSQLVCMRWRRPWQRQGHPVRQDRLHVRLHSPVDRWLVAWWGRIGFWARQATDPDHGERRARVSG